MPQFAFHNFYTSFGGQHKNPPWCAGGDEEAGGHGEEGGQGDHQPGPVGYIQVQAGQGVQKLRNAEIFYRLSFDCSSFGRLSFYPMSVNQNSS